LDDAKYAGEFIYLLFIYFTSHTRNILIFLRPVNASMKLEEGQLISVKNVSLSKATFVKFRAQSCDFLEISNPRAVLEVTLRKFTCLSVGDTICFTHSGKKFYLDVREVQPNGAASIIETDCNVDFEEPMGYKESDYYKREQGAIAAANEAKNPVNTVARTLQKAKAVSAEEEAAAAALFKPFAGAAKRIDGRPISSAKEAKADDPSSSGKTSGKASATASASASASASATAAAAAPVPPPAVPVYQSRIGDKYSKKKAVINALADPNQKFGGPSHKLGK
jgi:ubiquitin fusion degradation protein 1